MEDSSHFIHLAGNFWTHPFGRYGIFGYRRCVTCGAWILLWCFFFKKKILSVYVDELYALRTCFGLVGAFPHLALLPPAARANSLFLLRGRGVTPPELLKLHPFLPEVPRLRFVRVFLCCCGLDCLYQRREFHSGISWGTPSTVCQQVS